jgi:hypothetical protein
MNKKCKHCGDEFTTVIKSKVYCSRSCHNKAMAGRYMGGHYYLPTTSSRTDCCICPDCGKHHRRKNSQKWRFCLKCEERHERFGIMDIVAEEYHVRA